MKPTSPALLAALALSGCSILWGCTPTTHYVTEAEDAGATEPATEEADDPASSSTPDAGKADAAPAAPLACAHTTTCPFVRVTGAPTGHTPESTGGTVSDGHYVLKSAVVMSSGDFPKMAADLWIGGGRYEWQTANADQWKFSYGGTISYSGTRIDMTIDCGGQEYPPQWNYSASGSSLTVSFTTINGFRWVYVLERVS